MKKKILFWCEYFWPCVGGAEVFSAHLIQALKNRGYEFLVITTQTHPKLPAQDQYEGTPIFRFPFAKGLMGDLQTLKQIRKQIINLKKSYRPDLIHAHTCFPSLFYDLHTWDAYPCTRFLTAHTTYPLQAKTSSYFFKYLDKVDHISAVSKAVRDQLRKASPSSTPPIEVIYNGLPKPRIPIQPFPSSPQILILSRLSPEKGVDTGIKAFEILSRQNREARLMIAGDGPEKAPLEELTKKLGIKNRVDFLGWVPPENIYATINKASQLILPSQDEGLPLVSLQAGMMGRPMVATQVGGVPEVLLDGKTGKLVPRQDVEALAKGMDFLIRHPDQAKNMGLAAKERIEEKFSFEAMVESYTSAYQTLLQNNEPFKLSGKAG